MKTNKLREIAESKGREFLLDSLKDGAYQLRFYHTIGQLDNTLELTEKFHADKLAAALSVACDVIDKMSEALEKWEKRMKEVGGCPSHVDLYVLNQVFEEALVDAKKMIGE